MLPGLKTYIGAALGLLTAIYAFIEGQISIGELIQAVMIAATAAGLSAKGNRIETKLDGGG